MPMNGLAAPRHLVLLCSRWLTRKPSRVETHAVVIAGLPFAPLLFFCRLGPPRDTVMGPDPKEADFSAYSEGQDS
jgi:hypothetical protein